MLVALAEADRAPYPRRRRCPRLARSIPPSWSRCSAILRSVYVFLPPAHRGGRVIGTDALRILLISREPSDGQERNQDNEDNPNINAHQSSSAAGPPMLVRAILFRAARRPPLRCRGISSPAPSHAQVLERTSIKFAVHKQRKVNLPGQRCRTGLLQE